MVIHAYSDSKHRTELTSDDVRPVHSALYRTGGKERQFTVTEIHRMLQEDGITPTTTEWASSIFFAPKEDSSLCFYVNYCNLNASNE